MYISVVCESFLNFNFTWIDWLKNVHTRGRVFFK